MIPIIPESDDATYCGGLVIADFGTTTQVVGTIEDVLPPECRIEKPVDPELAWKELQRACRGN